MTQDINFELSEELQKGTPPEDCDLTIWRIEYIGQGIRIDLKESGNPYRIFGRLFIKEASDAVSKL